ncbi:phospho-sugar mutase [Georgenia sp. TF02-10]|uniref:phospho-sugar mutase n=1 Tax=Georgenia sp. TF02-10 TaxID=2917725 RepID=UPI001FA72B10|nr:phospho-sugar mutase [Georgenia sp. TF02-10]UNX54190.1 phospho-sugar mutase [Georgenia sp. TF02-10]
MTVSTEEVRAWIDADPDPATRAELAELLARATDGAGDAAVAPGDAAGAPGDTAGAPGDAAGAPAGADERARARAELAARFAGPLEFGTAGLRGALGAGPHRMNRAVVIRAAAGLAAFLAEQVGPDFSVVIGYDARHGSADFAVDTAAVVTATGGRARLLPAPLPTPVLAFAVRHLGADAGVMVTASHNPPQDNGYKVYLGGRAVTGSGQGAQIVPPYDEQIAAHIAAVGPAAAVQRAADGWEVLGPQVREAYLQRVASLVPGEHSRALRIVLTPMHGVGGATAVEALRRAGFTDVVVVPEQAEPDPDFPTVAFPNPEEPGALDLALRLARRVRADLVIANDPDADRCSAAVPDPAADGGWRQLTGDEIGSLLGEQTAAAAALTGRGVLASSVVSSQLLARIAQSHGLAHRTTLTGFKWIARTEGLVFGYEEAIGFCVDPTAVRDKDGISAAVRLAYLGAQLTDTGRTFLDALDDLARRHGLHHTSQLAVRVTDLGLIADAMARLRQSPPTALAGSPVTARTDLAEGSADLPPTDGLLYLTAAGDRVIVRPSGTEPKLKCYLEVVLPVADGGDVAAARRAAADRMTRLRADVSAAIGMS